MKVSIITAVRNGAATIADTVRSVGSQTYSEIEHVLIDGLSSDGTVQIFNRLNRRPGVVLSERDEGIYDAFNKGLGVATGDVIAYLNADDFLANDRVIERLVEEMGRRDADIVFGDALFVRPENLSRVSRHYDSSSFSPRMLRFGLMPAHPGMLVRRSLFERVGGFDSSYRIAGDFDFCVRAFLLNRCTFAYLPLPLVVMRSGGVSSSGVASTQKISAEMVRACRQNGIETSALLVRLRYLWKLREFLNFRSKQRSVHALSGAGYN
jgi:glycosyltransferase involved in cell wall biosynthesis